MSGTVYNTPAQRVNKIKALVELRRMRGGIDPNGVIRSRGVKKAEEERAVVAMADVAKKTHLEWRHALIDYRNQNQRIGLVRMTRLAAHQLNARLAGTGMGFAICGSGNPNTESMP